MPIPADDLQCFGGGVGDFGLQMKGLLRGIGGDGGWPSRVWREQLGVWWQNGLWEFKSIAWSALFPFGWQLQEGRVFFSKAVALFILHIFIEGCFQREMAFFFFSSLRLCFITDHMLASGEAALIYLKLSTRKQQNSVRHIWYTLALSRTQTHSVNSKHWLALVTDLQTAHPSLVIISSGRLNDKLAVIQKNHII